MRPANHEDWAVVGRVVGEAFADDPVSRWTLGTPVAIVRTFTVLAREVYLRRGGGVTAGEQGGAMWLRPGGSKVLPWVSQASLALDLVRESGLGSVSRALAVDAVLRRHRPQTPHYYLFAIGVSASARGRGLGASMIAAMTAEADREGVDCWLENTNPRNESLYRRMGFEVVDTFAPVRGCPPVSTMRRSLHGIAPFDSHHPHEQLLHRDDRQAAG